MRFPMKTRIGAGIAAVLVAATLLAGCSTSSTTASSPAAGAASTITVTDAWVKAANSGMSAAFGTFTNSGSSDVTLVSVTTPASSVVQLHETVNGTMREKAGGFVIPAGGTFALAPGANHIMLMNITAPLKAGDTVAFTLNFSDGTTTTITAPVKDFTGANESYSSGMGGMNGMSSSSASAGMTMGDNASESASN